MSYFMIDVSDPAAAGVSSMPEGFTAAAGYLGGDTPHVWTRSDWGLFNGWRKLPVWTASNPPDSAPAGGAAAWAAIEALWRISQGEAAVRGTPIGLDLETAVAPAFVAGFGSVAHWLGFKVWPYGSASTLQGNPPCDGYWAADWTGEDHLLPWSIVTQYASGTFDRSEMSETAYAELRIW